MTNQAPSEITDDGEVLSYTGPLPPNMDMADATSPRERPTSAGAIDGKWPLYEVFVRGKRGLNHVHVGSLRAADDLMALGRARDVYTRRNEGVSLWVVRSELLTSSSPSEKDPFFAPSGDKIYRHPTFYAIPDDVPHM
jgi:ring-1,2-phenylacetyl-CoA epoxidase subunit PaaB